MAKKKRKKRPQTTSRKPKVSKAQVVGQRYAVVHNKALLNYQRDTGIKEKIRERMKEESNDARLFDLEKRRQELLK